MVTRTTFKFNKLRELSSITIFEIICLGTPQDTIIFRTQKQKKFASLYNWPLYALDIGAQQ